MGRSIGLAVQLVISWQVTLAVTVERPDGAPRLGLAEHDFRLYEEGIPQDIVFFGAETVPVDLVLMLDSSASMTGRMTTVREAARNFIRALRPIDRAAVMTVGSRVHVLDSFNGNAAGLEDGIDSAQVGGNTALYDALYMALKQFGELPRGSDEVRRRASARSFFPTAIVDLDGVYASIAKELANQYSIGYTPQLKTAAHEFRRVAVAVDAPNVIVRTRRGYIAGG